MGLSLGHIVIAAVVILFLGSRRLPELGKAFGKSVRAFRDGMKEVTDDGQQKKIDDKGNPR